MAASVKAAVFGPPGAAAAVSKLLKLSPGQTEDALGTACTQACGLMSAQHKSMANAMQHGFAARDGLYGALMSQKGYTGIDQVFERPYGGYLATFGQGSRFGPQYKENELVDGFGEDWRGIDGIRVKKYNSRLLLIALLHRRANILSALQISTLSERSLLSNQKLSSLMVGTRCNDLSMSLEHR